MISNFLKLIEDLPTFESVSDDDIVSDVIEPCQQPEVGGDDDRDSTESPVRTVDQVLDDLDIFRDIYNLINRHENQFKMCVL